MQFNSIDFMIFFPVVLAVYFFIPRRLRSGWLLLASYWFYMSWNALYALLIGGSTVITYASGLLMAACPEGERGMRRKRLVMVLCIVVNLAILAVFKYGNFALDSVRAVLGAFHITVKEYRLNLLLPVGISFYTFQALGYMLDVYRGDVEAERSLPRYALFVSFFPQLVAGPIERSKNLLGQMHEVDTFELWKPERISAGAILMIWGYFMKMVVADRASLLVDTVFDSYALYGGWELLLAAAAFAIQIDCDFASYSLIATGAAKVMGFSLMENFNTPYFARSIKDFWNRWHISLSTWFRDYLYIPLGGNRRGTARKLLNLMIIFLVSGLWHGADWSFVFWGGLHGMYRVVGELSTKPRKQLRARLGIREESLPLHMVQTAVTFALVVFAWIFFRADGISETFRFIGRMLSAPASGESLGLSAVQLVILAGSVMLLAAVDLLRYRRGQTLDAFLQERSMIVEGIAVLALIGIICLFGEYGIGFDAKQFIYFQF